MSKETHRQSREERTLRVLRRIADRLHQVTNDSKDWESVERVEELLQDVWWEEHQYGR